MATRLRPAKWTRLKSCSKRCGLNPANLGDDKYKMVHGWYEEGLNDFNIAKNASHIGVQVSQSSVARPRSKHPATSGEVAHAAPAGGAEENLSDLDALDKILKVGSSQIDSWRITPSDWFKALDAKYKLTQGSAFQDTLEALAIAEDDEEEPEDGLEPHGEGPGAVREVHAEQRTPSGAEEVAEE